MAFPFPTPRLIKLRPVPAWSLRPPAPDPADLAAASKPLGVINAGLTAAPVAWGTCEIVLVAERERGATHKFFHDWRFEAVMRAGEPDPGTALAASPIVPWRRQTVAAVAAPVALVAQFGADAANPQTPLQATFTWTRPTERADPDPNQPLVLALTWLRQQLRDAGWQPEDASAIRYHKPAPVGPAAGAASAGASGDLATIGGRSCPGGVPVGSGVPRRGGDPLDRQATGAPRRPEGTPDV